MLKLVESYICIYFTYFKETFEGKPNGHNVSSILNGQSSIVAVLVETLHNKLIGRPLNKNYLV